MLLRSRLDNTCYVTASGRTRTDKATGSRRQSPRRRGSATLQSNISHTKNNPLVKLLDQVRRACRTKHLSLSTEQAYVGWTRRYVRYHGLRHPGQLSEADVQAFLSYLAAERGVAVSTQNQAFSALLFLYANVLRRPLGDLGAVVRAKRPKRLPVVLSRAEVEAVFAHLEGVPRLVASLLYGSGLRQIEALRLRVKDLDFDYCQLTVRQGKGDKDRPTLLPEMLHEALQRQLRKAQALHESD